MPQLLLPLVPDGATTINRRICVVADGQNWIYFNGVDPVFSHPKDDLISFRMFTAQLVCVGACTQAEIVRALGVSSQSLKRHVKKYRQDGASGFYAPRNTRGATVMTAEVIEKAQALFNQGFSRIEVARKLQIKYDTLRKAINQARLTQSVPESIARTPPETTPLTDPSCIQPPTDKSQRGQSDANAVMGVACTRPIERVLTAIGVLQGASTEFQECRDVTFGGVLCALPALIANGLFKHLPTTFPTLGGYYTTLQVVTLVAYMALCRIKTVEQLQYESPGELGKLMGLDRVPEVRCLRNKLAELSKDNAPEKWAGLLSQQWLAEEPDLAGALYVDGHVRLYHGNQTKLPKRYVSRQRLCLRGTTDYWVNDSVGQPFFRVERAIDHGMLEAIRSDIVPQLLRDVPCQPSKEELDANPLHCRFQLIFDREGYSPVFFREMWQEHRIGCTTYHKHPKEDWAEDQFVETIVKLSGGEEVSLKLAEGGSWIGSKAEGMWVREIRKLNPDGHQTSMISSVFEDSGLVNAGRLMSRWCQENFFRYMMEHYGIDLLSEYSTEEIPGTNRPVVNPRWRELDKQVRSLQGKLIRKRSEFAAFVMRPEMELQEVPKWEQEKQEVYEMLQTLESELDDLKMQRKETPKHVSWENFPAEEKFKRLAPSRKRLLDTIKMVAYRAETALVQIVREELTRQEDGRSLIRDLLRSDSDLCPDLSAGILKVRVHPMSTPRANRAVEHLLSELNASEWTYPGTELRLVYELLGADTESA